MGRVQASGSAKTWSSLVQASAGGISLRLIQCRTENSIPRIDVNHTHSQPPTRLPLNIKSSQTTVKPSYLLLSASRAQQLQDVHPVGGVQGVLRPVMVSAQKQELTKSQQERIGKLIDVARVAIH